MRTTWLPHIPDLNKLAPLLTLALLAGGLATASDPKPPASGDAKEPKKPAAEGALIQATTPPFSEVFSRAVAATTGRRR